MHVEIFIARHGQNEDNVNGILNGHRDLPLTELGRTQARQLAEGIERARLRFDAVYCSPLVRAHETAKIVAQQIGTPEPIVLPLLIERDFGVMTGKRIDQIEALCAPDIIKTDTITYFLHPEGAETLPELVARGQKILDTIRQTHNSGRILLVCHGDIGKMIYCAATNADWRSVLTDFHFGNGDLIDIGGTGEAHKIQLEQFNT